MRKGSRAICLVCLVGFAAIYAAGHATVDQKRQGLLLQYKSPQTLISGHMAQWVAGEFKGLLADYLLLEAGSFIGSNQKGSKEDWRNIHHTLKQALALDPYFQQSYLYAQGNLPWIGMAGETIELLTHVQSHRFWDWRPGFYAGFDYYYFFNDFASASARFLEAAKIENAPVLLPILGGRMAMKGQKTEMGIVLLQNMIDNQQLDEENVKEIKLRIEALKGVLFLEKAIERYRKSYDAHPDSLEQLIEKSALQALPENPYGHAYYYDAVTGRVAFDNVK